MKKISILFVLFFLFFPMQVFAQWGKKTQDVIKNGKLVCVTNAEFYPWEFKDGKEISGIDIEIAKKLAEKLNVSLEVTDVAFEAIALEIKSKKCDFVIAAMSATDEKKKSMDFSEKYFTSKQSILVKKDSDIKFAKDLKEKRVGVSIGTTGHTYCSSRYNIFVYNSGSEAVADLIAGAIDAVVIDDLPAKRFLNKNLSELDILNEILFSEDYRLAFPKGSDLVEPANELVAELEKENFVNKKIEKYLEEGNKTENKLTDQIYDNLIYKERYKNILQGIAITLKITIFSLILGLIIGALTALAVIYSGKNIFICGIKTIARIYVSIVRGTPIVCQLFIFYYILLAPIGIGRVFAAIIAFGVNSGAYVSEIIRSGILSVDHGQFEASYALGLNDFMTIRYVIAPQALKNSLASLCNEFIQLLKETSVAGFIGVVDLARAGEIIRSQTLSPLVPLISVAIIYFVIVWFIGIFVSLLEKKLRSPESKT